MNTNKEVYDNMIAERYRKEQNSTAIDAINSCTEKNVAVECYAGTGGLTEIYKRYFNEVITNDINQKSSAMYKMNAMQFIETILPSLNQKINLIDFDAYGCPAFEIQKFFDVMNSKLDKELVIRLSDGLGLWMKRSKNQDVLRKRYLIDGDINMDHIWNRHEILIDDFIKKLALRYQMSAHKIISVQTKYKNYCLGAWLITNNK